MTIEDLKRFISAMGIQYYTAEALFAEEAANVQGISYDTFKEIIRRQIMLALNNDRNHFMLLSLQEAEHLRGIFHARHYRSLLPSESMVVDKLTNARMWAMGDFG